MRDKESEARKTDKSHISISKIFMMISDEGIFKRTENGIRV